MRGHTFMLVKELRDHGRQLSDFATLWRGGDDDTGTKDVRLPGKHTKREVRQRAWRTRRANSERPER